MSRRIYHISIVIWTIFTLTTLVICSCNAESSDTVHESTEIPIRQLTFLEPTSIPAPSRYANVAAAMTQEERGLLAMVVYREARGECFDGQKAVVEVVFNRVLNDEFPSTIREVIYQKNQFSCLELLATESIKEFDALATAFDVIDSVIEDTEHILPEHYLYFSQKAPSTLDRLSIGCHFFSPIWY